MTDASPRIREHDRRDPDVQRLKEQIAILEHDRDKLEQLVQGMHYALFGLPEDRNNNGLVGGMYEINSKLQSANNKLLGILITALGAVAADVLARYVG